MRKTSKKLGDYRLRAIYTNDGWAAAIFREMAGFEVRECELPIYYRSPALALTAAVEEVKRMEAVSQLQELIGEWGDKKLLSTGEMLRLLASIN